MKGAMAAFLIPSVWDWEIYRLTARLETRNKTHSTQR